MLFIFFLYWVSSKVTTVAKHNTFYSPVLSEVWWHCWEVAIHEIMSKWFSVSGYAVLFQEWELYGTSVWRVFSMEEAQQALKTGTAGRVDGERFCAPSLHRNICILGARKSSPEKVNPWSIGRVQIVPFFSSTSACKAECIGNTLKDQCKREDSAKWGDHKQQLCL